jgi:hypothetical protein
MQLHETADERETKAQAPFGSVDGSVDLRKRLEYVRQHFGGNADSLIFDANQRLLAFLLQYQGDLRLYLTVFAGVMEQVAHHLTHSRQIGVHPDGAARLRHGQFVLSFINELLPHAVAQGGADGIQEFGQVERSSEERDFTHVDQGPELLHRHAPRWRKNEHRQTRPALLLSERFGERGGPVIEHGFLRHDYRRGSARDFLRDFRKRLAEATIDTRFGEQLSPCEAVLHRRSQKQNAGFHARLRGSVISDRP